MSSRLPRVRRLAPLLLILAGCQQTPDISAEIEEYADNVDDSLVLTCDCHRDVGYDTLAECTEALGRVDEGERQCLADALVGFEQEGKDYLDCVNAAFGGYLGCLELNASSCVDGAVPMCVDSHEQALATCPQLPASVDAAFAACR